jgi:DNA-binding transcriptional LysR family regulator
MKITIKQIECFLTIAELGSFSRASKRLNTAQPALSQAIKDLEAELGVRLFDRTTRSVELTEAGREFEPSAAKALEDLQLAVDGVHELAERRRGRVRVAAPPLLAAVVLPPAIAEFRVQFPGISIQIADVGTEQIIDRVRRGKADCGIGTFAASEEGIERVPLVKDSLMLFCDHSNPLNGMTSVNWSECAEHPLITLTRDSGIRRLIEVGVETCEIPLKPAYEVGHVTTAIALVEAGLGVAILPAYALAAARYRKVSGRPLVNPSISREVVMIHAAGRSISPAVQAFTHVVRRCVEQLTPQGGN